MKIRPYEERDRDNLRSVSVITGGNPKKEKDKKAKWYMFLDYYIEKEPDCCFVAANDKDEAVGFAIASTNYEQYEKTYRALYLKKLTQQRLVYGLYKNFELILSRKLGKKYPAHLHIDINPEYQRMGLGHKLMDALILQLHQKDVSSVFLVVGNKNEKGINFYTKYGFDRVSTFFNGIVYAIDVKDKGEKIKARVNNLN